MTGTLAASSEGPDAAAVARTPAAHSPPVAGTPAAGAQSAGRVPAAPAAAARARVALKRPPAQPPGRPALRRVERPLPEPEPVAVDDAAPEPAAEPLEPARGLFRRVADIVRRGQQAPNGSPPHPSPTTPTLARPTVARAPARMAVRDAGPPAPSAPASSLATAIATSGLGAVDAADGSASVSFPVPGGGGIPEYVPFSTAPLTMSRSLWDEAENAARGAVSDAGAAVRERAEDAVGDAGAAVRERAGSAIDPVTSALQGAKTSGAGAADKAFDDLYDRLKRELMSEQEQLGQLFHEP